MDANDVSQDALRRKQFFDYFRKRLDTPRNLQVPTPDRLFLLSGCLDALANHWHATSDRTITPRNITGSQRMREFLLRHGGHPAFAKVSAPMFRNATGQEIGSFPFADYRPSQMNRTRDWRDDPDFDEISNIDPDSKALIRWSYPGILYKDFRCAWVHKFVPINEDVRIDDADFLGRGEPYYRYMNFADRFLLMMPIPFILATLERAIGSFEREANARNVLPFEE